MSGTRMREPVDVTIVVPTFNERDNVPILIKKIEASLQSLRWEIIVVDDDSPDGTAQVVRQIAAADPRVRCIRRVHRRGLAGACLEGMLAAQADIVIVIDADLQHDVALIPALHAAVAGDFADVAIASRFMQGDPVDGLSGGRLMASRIAIKACRKLLRVHVSDPMSGFFATRRAVIDVLARDLSVDGFKLLLDIIVTSNRELRLLELPYVFQARTLGRSKLDARVSFDFAALFLAKLWGRRVDARGIKLLSVGSLSIAIHMAALWLLTESMTLSFALAQLCAFLVASTASFWIDNALDFSDRRSRGWRAIQRLVVFHVARAPSCLASLVVGTWFDDLSGRWWIAGAAGALIGATWNSAVPPRLRFGLGAAART